MKQWILICGLFCIGVMPFSSYAEDEGVIGSNLGFDFYSRIDDSGDTLAQGIVKRRLSEKGTYGALGCHASWLTDEKIDQQSLEKLRTGNTEILQIIASTKKITLTTESESSLRQCLVEKYDTIGYSAHQDQNALETVGNIGLYMDGDTENSDYDLVSDITRINALIFKEKYEYTGTKNGSAKSIANMLAGGTIGSLFPSTGVSAPGVGSDTSSVGSHIPDSETTGMSNSSESTTPGLPWAGVCLAGGNTSSSGISGSESIFGDGFFDDIGNVLEGDGNNTGIAYTPEGIVGSDSHRGTNKANFGISEKADFFHKPSCEGIFCITIDVKGGTQNALGGFSNTSIESLLEKHIKMMDSISYSDLSCNVMTMNLYEDSSKGKNLAKQIAGANLFTIESVQQVRNLEKEDTKESKDAVFDAAFRCAMNEAGLPGDPLLANGFIGAGYVPRSNQTTTDIAKTILPLGPQEMDNLAGCYSVRMGKGTEEAYKSLSTDLNEIQGFTDAMMNIIHQIIDTDKKLDSLPFCKRNMN